MLLSSERPKFATTARASRVIEQRRGQQLLEDNTILHVLASRDADRRDGARDGRVTKHIVGAGRLFNPPRFEAREW